MTSCVFINTAYASSGETDPDEPTAYFSSVKSNYAQATDLMVQAKQAEHEKLYLKSIRLLAEATDKYKVAIGGVDEPDLLKKIEGHIWDCLMGQGDNLCSIAVYNQTHIDFHYQSIEAVNHYNRAIPIYKEACEIGKLRNDVGQEKERTAQQKVAMCHESIGKIYFDLSIYLLVGDPVTIDYIRNAALKFQAAAHQYRLLDDNVTADPLTRCAATTWVKHGDQVLKCAQTTRELEQKAKLHACAATSYEDAAHLYRELSDVINEIKLIEQAVENLKTQVKYLQQVINSNHWVGNLEKIQEVLACYDEIVTAYKKAITLLLSINRPDMTLNLHKMLAETYQYISSFNKEKLRLPGVSNEEKENIFLNIMADNDELAFEHYTKAERVDLAILVENGSNSLKDKRNFRKFDRSAHIIQTTSAKIDRLISLPTRSEYQRKKLRGLKSDLNKAFIEFNDCLVESNSSHSVTLKHKLKNMDAISNFFTLPSDIKAKYISMLSNLELRYRFIQAQQEFDMQAPAGPAPVESIDTSVSSEEEPVVTKPVIPAQLTYAMRLERARQYLQHLDHQKTGRSIVCNLVSAKDGDDTINALLLSLLVVDYEKLPDLIGEYPNCQYDIGAETFLLVIYECVKNKKGQEWFQAYLKTQFIEKNRLEALRVLAYINACKPSVKSELIHVIATTFISSKAIQFPPGAEPFKMLRNCALGILKDGDTQAQRESGLFALTYLINNKCPPLFIKELAELSLERFFELLNIPSDSYEEEIEHLYLSILLQDPNDCLELIRDQAHNGKAEAIRALLMYRYMILVSEQYDTLYAANSQHLADIFAKYSINIMDDSSSPSDSSEEGEIATHSRKTQKEVERFLERGRDNDEGSFKSLVSALPESSFMADKGGSHAAVTMAGEKITYPQQHKGAKGRGLHPKFYKKIVDILSTKGFLPASEQELPESGELENMLQTNFAEKTASWFKGENKPNNQETILIFVEMFSGMRLRELLQNYTSTNPVMDEIITQDNIENAVNRLFRG